MKVAGGTLLTGAVAGCLGAGGDGGGGGSSDGGDGSSGDGSGGGGSSGPLTWDELVSKAQDEGEVNVFASASGVEPLDAEFNEQYGIEVKRARQGSKEVANRIIQGHTAGSQRIDFGALTSVPFAERMIEEDAVAKPPQVVQDELEGVTVWHADMRVAEAFVKKNLLWLHNGDVSNPPTTWEELVSGDFVVSVNNEDPEMLLVYENTFGQEEAREMIRQVGEIGTITTSHGSAGKGTAKGEYDVGLLMHKFMKLPWGGNLFWEPKTYQGEPIPMTATPNYAVVPKNPPNPHAAWLLFTFLCKNQGTMMEELQDPGDRASDADGDVPLTRTWYPAKEGHETFAEDPNVQLVTWEMGPEIADRLTVWKDILGIKSG